jgi:curved DNA-binding protein CbpA
MKDYYYILGVSKNASLEEIKSAFRKLSLKFHPDKNNGDEFFTERFKEIQEAYEILGDNEKRKAYDTQTTNPKQQYNPNSHNFSPEIEFFRADKAAFEYDEEITFSWKTINANQVVLKPFGTVSPIGQKTYKLKDFKNKTIQVELIAENTHINRQTTAALTLANKTYQELLEFFKGEMAEERQENAKREELHRKNNTQNIEAMKSEFDFIAIGIMCLIIFITLLSIVL